MPSLTAKIAPDEATENTALRTETACLKLTREELRSVQEASSASGLTRGEWMRDVVLRALHREESGSSIDPTLNEIVGVQLLLMNALKPVVTGEKITAAAFDSIVAEVHKIKKSVARKLIQEK